MSDLLRVASLHHDSIVDGPGLRYVIFTQGCPHACPGCHNPETHDPNGGYNISAEDIILDIQSNPLLQGVTFSGGEPLLQFKTVYELAVQIKLMGMDIWMYTGYVFEDFKSEWIKLLDKLDVIVDGPFVMEKRTLSSPWRGSSNQRVIDVRKTLRSGKVVERI